VYIVEVSCQKLPSGIGSGSSIMYSGHRPVSTGLRRALNTDVSGGGFLKTQR
jgi:hypothetical protein